MSKDEDTGWKFGIIMILGGALIGAFSEGQFDIIALVSIKICSF